MDRTVPAGSATDLAVGMIELDLANCSPAERPRSGSANFRKAVTPFRPEPAASRRKR